ncbi:tetratricopeptide repeat protein [Candidatus Microgenomates bacterium]|nr:tetratricopeptide repeat protein [Candidatus Microgenomates bacterium]
MLSHDQKKYIKKHIRDSSLYEMANYLKVDEKIISEYIRKRWGEEKLTSKLSYSRETEGTKRWTWKSWIYILILAILILITYTNALNNAFVSDDIAEIKNNPLIGDFGHIISTYPTGAIRHIIYWITFHIGDLNPAFFRFGNFVFHFGSAVLIFFIVRKIYQKSLVAFTAAALFAVHPAIAEAVVWISGGQYTQYAFFFLLSLLFYLLSDRKRKYYYFSIIFFLFTFASHPQMPLALFLIFPVWEISFGNLKKNWKKTIPYLVITIFYLFFSLISLPSRVSTLQSVHYQERGVDNIFLLLPTAISSYFELLFWPKTLTLYHSELQFSIPSFSIRAGITILLFVAFLVTFIKNRSVFFWLSFFSISLAPTLTPFRLNWIVAERYLYLPSVGIFTIVALVLSLLVRLKKQLSAFIYILVVVCVIVLSVRTIIRNIDWKNEDNLWIATGKTSPSSPNTHNNLGDVYGRWGDKQKALQEFQTAIMLKPNYADAYHNLANTYVELNDQERALENYKKATEFNPNLWQSYQNIAAIYFTQKKYDLALENIQKALSVNQKNLNLWNNLGIVYLTMGDKNKAKEVFSQVLSKDPQNQLAKQALIETSR